jgi:hypothetical protein
MDSTVIPVRMALGAISIDGVEREVTDVKGRHVVSWRAVHSRLVCSGDKR